MADVPNRNEILKELHELAEMGDTEIAHAKADDVICELLKSLGFGDVVEAYDAIVKWYA